MQLVKTKRYIYIGHCDVSFRTFDIYKDLQEEKYIVKDPASGRWGRKVREVRFDTFERLLTSLKKRRHLVMCSEQEYIQDGIKKEVDFQFKSDFLMGRYALYLRRYESI